MQPIWSGYSQKRLIETLNRARHVSVALVGIGEIELALSTVHLSHILDELQVPRSTLYRWYKQYMQ